jgi:hypothetical protein
MTLRHNSHAFASESIDRGVSMFASSLSGAPIQPTSVVTIDAGTAPAVNASPVASSQAGAGRLQSRTRGVERPARMPDQPAPATRVRRGGTLGKCVQASPFRECRGGEGLRETAISYVPFDQIHYLGEREFNRQAACEGWSREAIRRVDQRLVNSAVSLLDVVRDMRKDTTKRRSGEADGQFMRVRAFQLNPATLGLQRLRLRGVEQFDHRGSHQSSVVSMASVLSSGLRENEIAFVRLLLRPTTSSAERYGHALLVQRLPQEHYVVFDPNNGAFLYENAAMLRAALNAYGANAFSEDELGLRAEPHSIDYFSPWLTTPPGGEVLQQSSPMIPPPLRNLPYSPSVTSSLYEASADESNTLSGEALAAAAGGERSVANAFQGIGYYALREVARGRAPTLTEATDYIWQRLADPSRRSESIQEINRLQAENRQAFLVDLPNRTRRGGGQAISSAEQLVNDLRLHFGSSRDAEDPSIAYRNDLAEIRLTFRRRRTNPDGDAGASSSGPRTGDGYSVVVQRRGLSADYLQDRYEMHDPASGVYRLGNFDELAAALSSAMARGYPEEQGIDHVDTVYYGHYDDHETALHGLRGTPAPHDSRATNISLGEVERLLGVTGIPSQTPPLAHPTPEPDFGYEAPSATIPESPLRHVDLKRSLDPSQERKPFALFRPSTLTPNEVAGRGGFDCEQTILRNVSLDLHDFDLASRPGLIDSAGYLGTFRDERTAAARLANMAPDGFIYFVAPSPNMVDVNATLDSHAREPENAEVAAMGRIDHTQIRGWREVKNGVAGKFVRNPAYRWDIYNQTETAGRQPQLARFPIADDVWEKTGYRTLVSRSKKGRVTEFNEDPNRVHAFFYDRAWAKVRNLEMRQVSGIDYRGPFSIEAYGGGDANRTHLFISGSGWPYVASAYKQSALDPQSRHMFTMGEDGRLHVADDYDKVLRVNGAGNVYLGAIPSNRSSTNGVFDRVGSHLIHREDDKYLTTGKSVWTPFVSATREGARSRWALRKPDGAAALPPTLNEHTFQGKTGGQFRLYRFETDPDTALPVGTTHFVTKVPVSPYDGNFSGIQALMTPADVRDVSAWLYARNAAWLFRDGIYLSSPAPGRLEGVTLDGLTRWRAAFDADFGTARFSSAQVISNYSIGNEAWRRIRQAESRHKSIFNVLQ